MGGETRDSTIMLLVGRASSKFAAYGCHSAFSHSTSSNNDIERTCDDTEWPKRRFQSQPISLQNYETAESDRGKGGVDRERREARGSDTIVASSSSTWNREIMILTHLRSPPVPCFLVLFPLLGKAPDSRGKLGEGK